MEKTSNNKPRSVSNTVLGVQEFLVLVEYLFRCTDKKHQTSQKEINEYLVEKYGFDIRRDRINDIYEALYQFCKTNKDFNINIVKEMHGRCARYYLESRSLSDSDLVAIGSSMRNDKYLSTLNADKYIELLIKKFACIYQEEEIKKQIEDADKEVVKLSKLEQENLAKLSIPEAEKYIFNIEPKLKKYKLSYLKDGKVYHDGHCYLYDIIDSNDQPIAYFVSIHKRVPFAIPLSDFVINDKPIYMGDDAPDIEELFDNPKNKNIKEYAKEVDGGMLRPVSFKLRSEAMPYVSASFKRFFKFDMPYKYIERKLESHEKEAIDLSYILVEANLGYISFMNWLEDRDVARNIRAIKPEFIPINLARRYKHRIYNLSNSNIHFDVDLKGWQRLEDGKLIDVFNRRSLSELSLEDQKEVERLNNIKNCVTSSRLRHYLFNCNEKELTLSFDEIEEIIKIKLPEELLKEKAYWLYGIKNKYSVRLDKKAWEIAGYKLVELDLENKKVKFVKRFI